MTRVALSRSGALVAVLGALLAVSACDSGQQSKAPAPPTADAARKGAEPTVDVAELMKAGPLPEQVLGNSAAPVTIVEYASMTCVHCATFHNESFGHLKQQYIDTGKVKYIFREFPLDPLAYAGALLARCAGEGKYFPMLELLFKQQRNWAYAEQPEAALLQTVRQAGFTQESYTACLQDQATYDALKQIRQRAVEKFAVESTPTFFINGKIQRGAVSPQQLDKLIEPHLPAK
ncbi:MAG TPA: DsbA family protein [Beijerinckiaceae bacterium]|nr:DsbA family protein [Beijerinckiaceae bacterium]